MKKRTTKIAEPVAGYKPAKSGSMFSEASFHDLLQTGNMDHAMFASDAGKKYPPVISFFGLKGGVGRSLCLAYCADILAARGLRVAVIDFDFEAPGIHTIFGVSNVKKGSLAILEDGNYRDRPFVIGDSLQFVPRSSKGKICVLPAGLLDEDYLERLDNLRVLLWNEYEIQPITRLFNAFDKESFDVILVDCRTGFNGITASVLFHYSDLVVAMFPLSEQIWDGVAILAESLKRAKEIRISSPKWIIVPAMVPDTSEGKRLMSQFADRLVNQFQPNQSFLEETRPEDAEEVWALPNGIPYVPGIAVEGKLPDKNAIRSSSFLFQPLANRLIEILDLGTSQSEPPDMDYADILKQTRILIKDSYAEFLDAQEINEILVPSDDVTNALDPQLNIIVGAKGSGKTFLWRCAIEKPSDRIIPYPNCEYIIGHPPKSELDASGLSISRQQFEQIERKAKMRAKDSYEAFWILYCLLRICYKSKKVGAELSKQVNKSLRSKLAALFDGKPTDFAALLADQDILDECETLLRATDKSLKSLGAERMVLCYDGLDTDFQSATGDWLERRQAFIKGLLLMVSEYRGQLDRIQFKVFLREDIYMSMEGMQNKSHLEAFKKDIKFQSRDLWRLALNLITKSSPSFNEYVTQKEPGGASNYWDLDEAKLKALLEPLWGRTLEKGKAAISTNYVTKRTSDAQGRLFPRTFVQMLKESFEIGRKAPAPRDRVLSHIALKAGVEYASRQRVEDLTTEYVELKPYFDAMKGMKANFTTDAFRKHIGKKLKESSTALLHRPPGSWRKVLENLESIGLLSRADENGESWSVAFLYRKGLGVKNPGLN